MKDRRLTPKQIDNLLKNPNKIEYNATPAYVAPELRPAPELRVIFKGSDTDYDTLKSDEQIKNFCAFIRNLIVRYEENKRCQEEAETMEMDVEHAIVLAEKLTEKEKKQLYGKLTDVLLTRRACKNENEILQPLYSFFSDKTLLNKLVQLQGVVTSTKENMANRTYSCRTKILNDFRVQDEG